MEYELRDNEEMVKFEDTSKQFFKEIEENKNPQKLKELSESLLIQFVDCFEKAAKDKDDYNMKKALNIAEIITVTMEEQIKEYYEKKLEV